MTAIGRREVNRPDDDPDSGVVTKYGVRLDPEAAHMLDLLRIQARLDDLTAVLRGYEAFTGKGSWVEHILSVVQRHARRDLIWKAERGLPVTDVDVFKTSILDGRVSTAELVLMRAAADADRRAGRYRQTARARGGRSDSRPDRGPDDGGPAGGPPPPGPLNGGPPHRGPDPGGPETRGPQGRAGPNGATPTEHHESMGPIPRAASPSDARVRSGDASGAEAVAPLREWLATRPAIILRTMRENASLEHAAAHAELPYEATAVAWARTMVAARRVAPADLPPAVREWVAVDAHIRAAPADATPRTRDRARLVDALTAATPIARRYAMRPFQDVPQGRVQPEATAAEAAPANAAQGATQPAVWIDGMSVPGRLIATTACAVTVEHEGRLRTYPGALDRRDGPAYIAPDGSRYFFRAGRLDREGHAAVERPDAALDRYYRNGVRQPLRLPTPLMRDRAFRARLYPLWEAAGFPPAPVAAAVVLAEERDDVRARMLTAMAGSSESYDHQWAAQFRAAWAARPPSQPGTTR